MSTSHGKKTVILLNGVDVSAYGNNSTVEVVADKHDTTTYGKNTHVFDPGLLTNNFTLAGFYDTNQSTGPQAFIKPLVGGAKVPFVIRPEGTGVGLPQTSGTVMVEKYNQTQPVSEYITFAVDLQGSDDFVDSIQ